MIASSPTASQVRSSVPMAAGPSLAADVVAGLDPDLRAAHRPVGIMLSMDAVLSGAPGPSPVPANLISV
jgi:hypothetical protein